MYECEQNERTAMVPMSPYPESTRGHAVIKERQAGTVLRFLPRYNFRGKLKEVILNEGKTVLAHITAEDEEFALFEQVGERPEIRVPANWFDDKITEPSGMLRVTMKFDTFRQEDTWYGFLYIKLPADDPDAAYIIKPCVYECDYTQP